MNKLLKRQIRKHLDPKLATNKNLENFLNAIDKSYTNFDEQFIMLQRAMSLSSDELFEANVKLRDEAKKQEKLIGKLKNVIDSLNTFNKGQKKSKKIELDSSELADFIDNQTNQIIEINEQREKLLNDLSHQNQELSDYAHMVSHDLKSPLRNINTLTSWFKEDYIKKVDTKGKEQLNLITSNVVKMEKLINGILEYSTIGKVNIEINNLDLNKLIEKLLNSIIIPKNITVKILQKLPTIKGNKYRIQQLFQNLISNAIKYNNKPEGLIEIGYVQNDNSNNWQFYIKDNGIGIDKVYFKKIFEAFQKLEANQNSTGIGLSIVKKIVTVYNGKIWVESKLDEGTTFHFTLKK